MSKRLAIGLGIIAVVVVAISAFGLYNLFFGNFIDIDGDNVYATYYPGEYLDKNWELVADSKNLAEFDTSLRLGFIDKGTIDAAAWDFEKEDETLHVWVRKFDTRENLETEEKHFMSPLVWDTYTQLLYADVGITGIRKMPEADNPFSIYVDKDDIMIYIYYYNAKDPNQINYYDDSDMADDRKFLIDLTKDMLGL